MYANTKFDTHPYSALSTLFHCRSDDIIQEKKQPNSALYSKLCPFSKIESQSVLEKENSII